MAYASYEDYVSVYGGNLLTSAEFYKNIHKASAFIDYVTFNRVTEDTPYMGQVIKAACGLAELMCNYDSPEIEAEKVGNYSVSYALEKPNQSQFEKQKYQLVKQYLSYTGLMYRG